PIWRAATYLSSMAGSPGSPITGAITPPSSSIPAPMSRSPSCSRIRATSRPQACMNHWASPRSIRPAASPSRSTSAAKPACPAFTPRATSPTPSCPRSLWHHRTARRRVSPPSSRCWFESTDSLLRLPRARLSFEVRRQAAPISTPETITRRSGALSLVEAGSLETMRALASIRLPLASIKGYLVKNKSEQGYGMAEQNAYQVADWNGQSGERWVAYQARLDAMVAVFGQAAIEAAAPATGERVLDVGCGAGASSLALAARVGAGGQVLGVDISEPLIGRARALAPQDTPVLFR